MAAPVRRKARRLLRDPGAQFGKEAALDFGDAFVGGQDFAVRIPSARAW